MTNGTSEPLGARPRAVTATLWSAADALGRQAVQLLTAVVLARLLSPDEFGTVALLALVLGVASVLADAGFSTALVQRPAITAQHETGAFVVVVGLGLVVTTLLEVLSPWVAAFYGQPELNALLRALALNVFVATVGAVPLSLLTRQLAFRRIFAAGIVASLFSGAVAVVTALSGWGVWSLAAQSLTMSFTATVLYWAVAGWRPRARFRVGPTRELASFGGYMLASSLLDVVFTRAYTVLIGRRYGAADVGQYQRADSTQQLPAGVLSGIVSRVALPYFSSIAQDRSALRSGLQAAIRGLMLINVPMMLGLAALAGPVVRTLFGDQWEAAVPILRVLSLAACLWPLHVLNLSALLAQGHAHLMFRLEVVKKVLGIALLVVGSWFGVLGVAWAMAALATLAAVINTYYSTRLLGYGLVQQGRDVAPMVVLAAGMAIVVAAVAEAWQPAPWLAVAVLVPVGASLFLGGARFFRLAALADAVRVLHGGLTSRSVAS